MNLRTVGRTGHIGWVGALFVVGLWWFGWSTRDEPFMLYAGSRTGTLAGVWWILHGLIVAGTTASAAVQRLPRRPAVVLGILLAFFGALGVEVSRVAADMDPGMSLLMGAVGVAVFMLGLGPTAVLAGALGGLFGSLFASADDAGGAVETDAAPEHLSVRMRERYDATRIVRATLEGREGRLGTMESTVAFTWVKDLLGVGELEREELRWRGIEVDPLAELIDGRIAPSKVRARLLDATTRILDGLACDRVRPSYR